MANNVSVTAGSGTTMATHEVGSAHHQLVKPVHGADGVATPVSLASGMPVQPATSTTWAVTQSGSWSMSITGTVSAAQSGSWTVAATQSGSWTVTGPLTDAQLRATAVPVSLASAPLPTDAATASAQATQLTALQLLDDAVATIGSAVVAKGQLAAGTDGTNARALLVDSSGNLRTLPARATTPTRTTFSSTTSGQLIAANAARKQLFLFIRPASPALHILLGTGTVSSTNETFTLYPDADKGLYYEFPPGVDCEITAKFADTAGVAVVTEVA